MQKYIVIKGARENNLKNINLSIPKDKLVILTGVSGSGKTSLAFDTIYAEGQRRYVESLSTYARQFLGNSDKPDVDSIEGLSPSISIDQKTTSKNPRSTVGTVTEIYDYLRLLYARIGTPYCPTHKCVITSSTITSIVDTIMKNEENSKLIIYSPIVYGQKGSFTKVFELINKEGFSKIRVDNETLDLLPYPILDKNIVHNIDIVVDRLKIRKDSYSRIYSSLEVALKYGEGKVIIQIEDEKEKLFSTNLACPHCNFSIPKMEPRIFSFNSPFGACPTCKGLGIIKQIDLKKIVPDESLSINQGAIKYFKNIIDSDNIEWQTFKVLLDFYSIDRNKPFKDLEEEIKEIVYYGSKENISYKIITTGNNVIRKNKIVEGVCTLIQRRYQETTSSMAREYYDSYLKDDLCYDCSGNRLDKGPLNVLIHDLNIIDFTNLTIKKGYDFLDSLELNQTSAQISEQVIKEIKARFNFLINVGLDYLTLSRSSGTLSGGEAQRIRLATQIGSKLTGVLYVLDEPSIGLHQCDNQRLINSLKEMRDLGNTLIVVEHDEEIMMQSDYIVDIGPNAGRNGGEVVACGTVSEIMNNQNSLTGLYLSKKLSIQTPKERKKEQFLLTIKEASENNLKNIDCVIKGGCLNVITGVSGSGKSTLMNEVLKKYLYKKINKSDITYGKVNQIIGYDAFTRVIDIDQSPIGRTPRSNPATYTGVFDPIRELFSQTTEAKVKGYTKSRFSFNLKGGRCEKCSGDGVIRIEMHFLPDVYVPCEECKGKRYNRETLDVLFKGKSIADVLDMLIDDACDFFENIPSIKPKLDTLKQVGLGYLKLGQASTSLSGGEAQRVKLATELSKRISSKTIYLLDEPTTGLHSYDVSKLLEVIKQIVSQDATVVIIEHNLDVIKCADHIIDLGPHGGDRGGYVVCMGTPEEVSLNPNSFTGIYLKKVL